MSEQIRQLVDIDDHLLSKVQFGRNRFLRVLGITIFSFAARMMMPQNALAHHSGSSPFPCYGFHACPQCSGTTCYPGCQWHTWHSHGCSTGGQCWYTCTSSGLYACCDWHHPTIGGHDYCICSQFMGSFC